MSELPDWILNTPSQPGIHNEPPRNYQFERPSADELRVLRKKLIDSILQLIIQAATGFFHPNGGTPLNQLATFLHELLGPHSPLNATNLKGVIQGQNITITPGAAVSSRLQDFLVSNNFASPFSILEDLNWAWDGAEGIDIPGTARVDAHGYLSELLSNQLIVDEGDNLSLGVSAKWTGLAYTGSNPIVLGVTNYVINPLTNIAEEVGSADLITIASPGASSDWTPLSTTYVVPAGVDEIRMRFKVPGTVSAGSIWFDKGELKKTDLVKDKVVPGIGTIIDNTANNLFGLNVNGWAHSDMAAALFSQNGAVVDAGSEIAALWAQIVKINTPGNTAVTDDFERAASSTLGANWEETLGGGNGSWSLDGHYAYWEQNFPNGNRDSINRWVGTPSATITDYQTISMVLGSKPTKNLFGTEVGYDDVIGRCDSTKQNYIRFRVGGDGSWQLHKIIGGSATLMTSGTANVAGSSAVLQLTCGDKATLTPRHFTVKVNNTTLDSGVFGDTTSVYGASNRYMGFGGRAESLLFELTQHVPGKINAWIGRDTE